MKSLLVALGLSLAGCSHSPQIETVNYLDLDKFMGTWYVLGGRFTAFESEVHNGVEIYEWNSKEKRIDISFTYNKGGFDGKVKSLPQKGWVVDTQSNSRWEVSPFWPLKFDYLVLEVADDYSWTIIGVPNQKYFWIMARDWKNASLIVAESLRRLKARNYDTTDMVLVPHQHGKKILVD